MRFRLTRSAMAALVLAAIISPLRVAAQPLPPQTQQTPPSQAPPASTPVNRYNKPCESNPDFRKFDFWIGEWDVQRTGVPRAPLGSGASSRVERALDGCVILEHWTPLQGAPGKSFNTYNSVTKMWEQYWVDGTGRITHYRGTFKADGNLYYEADQFGSSNKIRMTFFNEGPDQVRQLGHLSTDGGATWNVSFDLTYMRKR